MHTFVYVTPDDLITTKERIWRPRCDPLLSVLSASQTTYYPNCHRAQSPRHHSDRAASYRWPLLPQYKICGSKLFFAAAMHVYNWNCKRGFVAANGNIAATNLTSAAPKRGRKVCSDEIKFVATKLPPGVSASCKHLPELSATYLFFAFSTSTLPPFFLFFFFCHKMLQWQFSKLLWCYVWSCNFVSEPAKMHFVATNVCGSNSH